MHDKLAKLMAKKKGRPMDDLEKEAKMGVIKDLSSAASDAMRGKLSGLKKITIASDSAEGLKKGLEKAEEIIESSPGMEEAMSEEGEMVEDAEDGEAHGSDLLAGGEDEEEMSEEELDAKLAKLMEKKQKLEAKKKA
jgi:hypothetical protein